MNNYTPKDFLLCMLLSKHFILQNVILKRVGLSDLISMLTHPKEFRLLWQHNSCK